MPSITRAAWLMITSPVRVSARMAPSAITSTAMRSRSYIPPGIRKASYHAGYAQPQGSKFSRDSAVLAAERLLESGVKAALGDQLVVGSLLDDDALVHDDNEVGVANGREPMRDDEGRA